MKSAIKKYLLRRTFFLMFLLPIRTGNCFANVADTITPAIINNVSTVSDVADTSFMPDRSAAILLLNKMDTTVQSTWWPNVPPGKLYQNIKENVLYPNKLYQGILTNFCGYAAFTNYMIRIKPALYVQLMLDLYNKGTAVCNKAKLHPSEPVRYAAGILHAKGILDIHYADQLLFLSLADHFKSYINLLNRHYDPGDEDLIWAATTFGKFKRMMKKMLDVKLKALGSDLIRPPFINRYKYIHGKLKDHDVILFVNGNFLNPSLRHFITLRVPTHYIHLYSLEKKQKGYLITYWDYGLKTQQAVTKKMFDKLVFGIITIKRKQSDEN